VADEMSLKELLTELGIKQVDLARELKVSPNTVSRWIVSGSTPAYVFELLRTRLMIRRSLELISLDVLALREKI